MIRRLRRAVCTLLLLAVLPGAAARAEAIEAAWAGISWGDSSDALMRHFGARATALPRAIDFGDSYVDVVLRRVVIGGYELIAFYQMDKAGGGLKRIQFERQRHGVGPAVFRAVVAALAATYGPPDIVCGTGATPESGYQSASEISWRRSDGTIRAIFRDTTIEAFEGCLAGDPSLGPCGLTGQILVRISPPDSDAGRCLAPRPATAR